MHYSSVVVVIQILLMSGEKCSHQNISLRKNPKKDCSSDGSVVVVDVVLVVVDVVVVVVVVVIWLL